MLKEKKNAKNTNFTQIYFKEFYLTVQGMKYSGPGPFSPFTMRLQNGKGKLKNNKIIKF